MVDRLASVRLKVKRAELHRKTLDDEGQAWVKRQKAAVIHNTDTEPPWHRLVVDAKAWEEPPPHWGIVLGDLIHNLRSALDHMIWQLVLANNRTPGRNNQFPIYSHKPSPDAYGACVKGVADPAKAKIRKLQPYMRPQRPEPEPLEIIGFLSNIDKHQTIHAAATIVSQLNHTNFDFTPRGEREATAEIRWNQSVGKPPHQAELVAVRFDPPEADVQFEEHPNIPVSVAFGKGVPVGRSRPAIRPVEFGRLTDLIEAVARVGLLLEPFTR